ncbi:flagellar basal body protein FliL [Micromonospora sp. NPDC050187]|uniref:LppU/SCO3897 family protein n=1 Tax=Micromonospora sp. NPDC050187 TaxID=3364277 RepID=UPI0037999E33
MANYGPPGANRPEPWHEPPDESHPWRDHEPPRAGGYPGSGRQPWNDGHRQGYDQPWNDGPRQGGAYPVGEPAYLGHGPDRYPPEPADPPRRSGGRGRMVAVLAVLALLVLGGGTALFLLARADEPDPPPVTALPSATATPSGQPAGQPDGAVDGSPNALAPESSADPRFAKAGQCVRNDGRAGGRPKLLVTGCGPKTYEVLRRFDGATSGEKDAEAKCADVDGYTDWYFYNSELDTLDFVLCLKLR